MTPGARILAAAEIIDTWRTGEAGLDRVLAGWGRTHRFAGSGDRRAIADLAYDTVRRLRSAAWVAGAGDDASGQALLHGSLILDGADPTAIFAGDRRAAEWHREGAGAPARPLQAAARGARLDLPDWLLPELDGAVDATLAALRERAPLDLRVNLLKTEPGEAIAALAAEGIEATPAGLSPTALRVGEGRRFVASSRAYRQGLVEVQDAASQAVADLAAARPGETVLDLCAGGGGKTLALAAAMQNSGQLIAHDIAPARIAALPVRARRAGADVEIRKASALESLSGACNLVLVDAPCSGSGAWRRNPDAKWRFTPAMLDRLTMTQDRILDRAARLTRPGGRILYATCSLIARENRARIATFLARTPGWRLGASLAIAPPEADGFFAALLEDTRESGKN